MASLMQCLYDITTLSHQSFQRTAQPSHLIGSTEQVSDNLNALATQERWDRDNTQCAEYDWRAEQSMAIRVEEQLAMAELKHAHQMFRFTAGTVKRMFHLQALEAIRMIRALRWEQASLQEWP